MPRIMRAYILSENGSERVPEPKPEPEVELKTEPDLEPVEEAQKNHQRYSAKNGQTVRCSYQPIHNSWNWRMCRKRIQLKRV